MSAKQNNAPYKGVFEGMDFEPYSYEHFPLWMHKEVKGEDGKTRKESVLVEDSEEESAAADKGFATAKGVGKPIVVTENDLNAKDDEIAQLRAALAEARGLLTPKAPLAGAHPAPLGDVPKGLNPHAEPYPKPQAAPVSGKDTAAPPTLPKH